MLGTQRNVATVLIQLAGGNHSNGYCCNSSIQHIFSQTTENKEVLKFITFGDHFVLISIHQK
jgi:hypothetical protein